MNAATSAVGEEAPVDDVGDAPFQRPDRAKASAARTAVIDPDGWSEDDTDRLKRYLMDLGPAQ